MLGISRREKLELWLAGLGGVIFALIFCYPLLQHFSEVGRVWDWDQYLQLEWVPLWTVTHFHQLPLWNPYECGGIPIIGHPNGRVLSPFFLLHLLFGLPVGLHLEIILQLAICFFGGYLLGKHEDLNPFGCIACASIFPASSWFYLHMAAGHLSFIAWLALPWVALFTLLAIESGMLSWAVLAGLVTALMWQEGGVYPTGHAILLAAVLCVALAISGRSLRPLMILAVIGMFTVGFGAIKLLPAYNFMQLYPRPMGIKVNDYPARALAVILFSRNQDFSRVSVGSYAFYEYGTYISPFAAAVAVLGLFTSPKRLWPWIAAAMFFLVLALGDSDFPYAWQLLHSLPPFSSERITARFLVPMLLAVGVIAGYGADFVARRASKVLAVALVAAAIIDAWLVGDFNLAQAAAMADPPVIRSGAAFQQFATGYPATNMYPLEKSNRGDPTCYEPMGIPSNVVGSNQPGYRGEQYLLGPGSITLSRWTPNALSYDVVAPDGGMMVVNQNYEDSWRIVEGAGKLISYNGLIGIDLPAGRQHLKIAFRSYPFVFGAAITLLTFIVGVLLFRAEITKQQAAGSDAGRAKSR
jgi:hypothetical protein